MEIQSSAWCARTHQGFGALGLAPLPLLPVRIIANDQGPNDPRYPAQEGEDKDEQHRAAALVYDRKGRKNDAEDNAPKCHKDGVKVSRFWDAPRCVGTHTWALAARKMQKWLFFVLFPQNIISLCSF